MCVCVCVYVCIHTHIWYIFIHSFADEHLGCVYILEIVNNASLGIMLHVSFQISIFAFFWIYMQEWNYWVILGFPGASVIKNPPAMQEMQIRSLGQEDLPEKEMATHSSILAWEIPWTKELGRV